MFGSFSISLVVCVMRGELKLTDGIGHKDVCLLKHLLIYKYSSIQISCCLSQIKFEVFSTLKDDETNPFIAAIQEFVRDPVAKISRPCASSRALA